MKVINQIDVVEIDGKETVPRQCSHLLINSHWDKMDLVVLQFQDSRPIAVRKDEIMEAIRNSTNWIKQ